MKKVGIIGCGSISQVHCKVIAGMKDAELSVLCDVAEERAAGLKKLYLQEKAGQVTDDSNKKKLYDRSEYGGPEDSSIENDVNNPADRIRICTDWHELAGMDLEVVHICTPHFLHVPMAVELLDAGKAVFMEKPCAISEEQFMELKAADERHPGKLGICFQNRYNETTGIIDKAISEGRIGRVIGGRAFVTWRRDEGYYAGSPWKGRIATEGGGALINQSIHTLDLLLRYLGEPKTVRATVSNHHLGKKTDDLENIKIDIEDTVEAWMEFENGVLACFYASNGYAADAPVILEIQGDKGRISMNGSTVILSNKEDGFLLLGSDIPIKNTKAGPSDRMLGQTGAVIKDYWGLGHKACIEDFYRCLDTGRGFAVNLRSVENSFHTMMRVYEKRQGTVLCLHSN